MNLLSKSALKLETPINVPGSASALAETKKSTTANTTSAQKKPAEADLYEGTQETQRPHNYCASSIAKEKSGQMVAPGVHMQSLPASVEAFSHSEVLGKARHHALMGSSRLYKEARKLLFGCVDNKDGIVHGVYTDLAIFTHTIPDASGASGMNTEHTWPRSSGLKGTPAVYDLHHLFPTDSKANNRRGNLPFGVVSKEEWSKGESKLGPDENGRTVFEPPDGHKGNVARAMFYIAKNYNLTIDDEEEMVLRAWHKADPADNEERVRNKTIEALQGNRNFFIDFPELPSLIHDF